MKPVKKQSCLAMGLSQVEYYSDISKNPKRLKFNEFRGKCT
jgi:hypothetical protein